MRILYYCESRYLIFDVSNDFMVELFDLGRSGIEPEDSNEDMAIYTGLYQKFTQEADYIGGDNTSLPEVYISFLNGVKNAPDNVVDEIRTVFSEVSEKHDHAVFGALNPTGAHYSFSISSMDKAEFEEQSALYAAFAEGAKNGTIGHA